MHRSDPFETLIGLARGILYTFLNRIPVGRIPLPPVSSNDKIPTGKVEK